MAKREILAIIKSKRKRRAGFEKVFVAEKAKKAKPKAEIAVKPLELTVDLPEGVEGSFEKGMLSLRKGSLIASREFSYPRVIMSVAKADGKSVVRVGTKSTNRTDRAVVGTWAAHVRNMLTGVTKGYEYRLKIIYSHFPLTVKVVGKEVQISNFVGEKSPRRAKIVGEQTKVDVQKEFIVVSGSSKEEVGQTCTNLERACFLPNRDRRRFPDGIYLMERGVKA